MKVDPARHLAALVKKYPALAPCEKSVAAAFRVIAASFRSGGKLLIAGNGGSAADAEHIVGELMKSFLKKRPVPKSFARRLGDAGLAKHLAGGLPTLALSSQASLITAVANDCSPDAVFAQGVYGCGRKGDALLAISTSGKARNVICALKVARALGIATVGLTGAGGGAMRKLCDALVAVPARSTPAAQELHVPVYHALCAMLEEEFF